MASKTRRVAASLAREWSIVFVILAAFVAFSLLNPRFARMYNVLTVLQHASLLCIISTGLTLVVIMDEFDLSFATLSSAAVCLSVNMVQTQLPGSLAVLTALGVGLLVGLVNGFLVAKLNLRSFIATLGTGTILTGLNYSVSGGKTIVVVGGLPDWFNFLGQESFFRISYLVPVMLVIVALATILVRYTELGRNMYGIGANREACRVAGVNVAATQIVGFALCGLIAGLTGFLLASRLGGGHPLAGEKFLLQGFAAVFIGMTMKGGIPSILGTFLGSIFLAELESGLTLVDVDYRYQYVVNGLIIVIFVCIAYVARNRLTARAGARWAVAKT
jgi:ribose transport system permease protein